MDTRTLVATFNNYSTAQQAVRDLEALGVPADAVHVDSNTKTVGAGRTASSEYSGGEHEESGFSSWWKGLFGSDEDDADRAGYEGALERGETILRATVPSNMVNPAVEALNRNGAVDIDRGSGSGTSNRGAVALDGETGRESNGPLEVIEEELQVGKRAFRRGGVRVFSHVVSKPVEEQVQLREERVKVERRPVNREISPADVSALRDQTIEVTEMAEEAVIGKRARVREEVVIEKQASERTETVRDNVRHTEVEVEQLGREANVGREANLGRESNRGRESNLGRESDVNTAGTGRTSSRSKGMSPNEPAPLATSGLASTPGAGTLAGDVTAGSGGSDYTPEYRRHFEQTFGPSHDFESTRPAYEYGYQSASNPRYRGKSWDQVENDLRSDYESRNPGSTWEQTKAAVRHGWEKVTGQR